MSTIQLPRKLWEHPDPESTKMAHFMRALERDQGLSFATFQDLYEYSVKHRAAFWDFLLKYSCLIYEGRYTTVVDENARMDSIPPWFEGLRLNFAENMLLSAGVNKKRDKEDDKIAVTEVNETGLQSTTHWTWGQLRQRTGRLLQALKAHGVRQGDRVAVVSCNNMNTLLVFLAATALGAIFSSSSTEMGLGGILDRLLQIKPRWVFMEDCALYNGKVISLAEKIKGVITGMRSIQEFKGVVSMPRNSSPSGDVSKIPGAQPLSKFIEKRNGDELEFRRVPFRDPFLIVYSSGTTGAPKCIVHSVGGVLLTTFKEGGLHMEVGPESVLMQYTTTSWIMYLAQVQNLMLGTRLVLYDGSPFLPHTTILLKLVERERITHMGISPRYLHELQKMRIKPKEVADLSALQMVTSTGMVLAADLFEWFYDQGFPAHVRLNNISGGTDLAGCFGVGNSLIPVYVGGCPGLSLGIRVEVYDSQIEGSHVKGRPVPDGVAGELVATAAFPNQPVMFWGQDGPKRYHDAYFARFDNVWTHGDFVMIHPATKQLMFLGRSDGVLNPSGVRFGSSEIYKIIDSQFLSEVSESICVGQRRPSDRDERVFLFLLMRPGVSFTPKLVERIKSAIRKDLSARHVPKFIFPTPQIPTTVNMKKVELPVKQIISGSKIKPSGTLLNPESLEYYYQFAHVEDLEQPQSKL